jgi:four helix bundle suffix protein
MGAMDINGQHGRNGPAGPGKPARPPPAEPLIPKHGGYRRLKSFQVAQLVYDVTVRFCDRYIDRRSRTHDQMVQAARSGVQNIAEGSQASGRSKKTELKLTNVARASLEELRLDYEDFLRQRGLPLWPGDDPRRKDLVARRCQTADDLAGWVKQAAQAERAELARQAARAADAPSTRSIPSMQSIPPALRSLGEGGSIQSMFPAVAANAALVLIGVASSLLARQIDAQAAAFENEGGFTERLYRVRTRRRGLAP